MSENNDTRRGCPDVDAITKAVMECVKKDCYGYSANRNGAEITRETNIWKDLGFDQLDMVGLIIDVEECLGQMPPYFSVTIPEEICDGIETVGDLVDAAHRVMGV